MKVLVVTDIHIHIINEKKFLSKQIFHIIKRYYDAFGDVVLFCREDRSLSNEEMLPAEDIVSDHIGFKNFFGLFFGEGKDLLEQIIRQSDLIVGRFHSFSACAAASIARKNGKPFLAEIMGDAWDGYWNHGLYGKIIAPVIFARTKKAIKHANYGLYVTERYLQKKYPCRGCCIGASNVEIDCVENIVLEQRIQKLKQFDKTHIVLMTAANADVRAKGHEYVIKAIPKLRKKGITVEYLIAGGGNTSYLKGIAKTLGVLDSVVFLGRLSSKEVREWMDRCDFYVQPSLQEGLPRAVIEAMSRACPCLGSNTAGTPELLSVDCVFKRKSSNAIAKKIEWYINQDLIIYAKRNFENAKNYTNSILNSRRNAFFSRIRAELDK